MKNEERKTIKSDLNKQAIDTDQINGGLKRGQDDLIESSDSKFATKMANQAPGVTPKAKLRRAAKINHIGPNGKIK